MLLSLAREAYPRCKLRSMKTLAIRLTAALAFAAAAPAAQQPASAPVATVVQMSYYAQPGKENDVLQNRLRACAVLEARGLGRGRVMTHAGSSRETQNVDSPDVVWEGEFPDAGSLQRYEDVADKDADFLAARQKMSTLTRKTERRYFQVR